MQSIKLKSSSIGSAPRSAAEHLNSDPTEERHADEVAIRSLIERWSQAVRDQDLAGIRADHDADILMFDVPPPFASRGLEAYMSTWDTFLSYIGKPVSFALHDVNITCGQDVAFATATGSCTTPGPNGAREPLGFRLTMGLRKIDGKWRILHEHHSVPTAD